MYIISSESVPLERTNEIGGLPTEPHLQRTDEIDDLHGEGGFIYLLNCSNSHSVYKLTVAN